MNEFALHCKYKYNCKTYNYIYIYNAKQIQCDHVNLAKTILLTIKQLILYNIGVIPLNLL